MPVGCPGQGYDAVRTGMLQDCRTAVVCEAPQAHRAVTTASGKHAAIGRADGCFDVTMVPFEDSNASVVGVGLCWRPWPRNESAPGSEVPSSKSAEALQTAVGRVANHSTMVALKESEAFRQARIALQPDRETDSKCVGWR